MGVQAPAPRAKTQTQIIIRNQLIFVTAISSFNAFLQCVVEGAAVTPVANNVAAFEPFIKPNDASQQPFNNGNTCQAYTATVQQILASVPTQSAASGSGSNA